MKTLSVRQRKYLKGRAHSLKPVVTVGPGGLSPGVVEELARNIAHHELMKIKLPAGGESGTKSDARRGLRRGRRRRRNADRPNRHHVPGRGRHTYPAAGMNGPATPPGPAHP